MLAVKTIQYSYFSVSYIHSNTIRTINLKSVFYNSLSTRCYGNLQKNETGRPFRNSFNIPWTDVEKTKMAAAGYFLYENTADKIDYTSFFHGYNLSDTFYSWFVVTELHIWMLAVRAMSENQFGPVLRASIMEALWNDVNQRVKRLEIGNSRKLGQPIYELHEQLQAAFIAYDEGIQSSDITLGSAIWRRFYQMNYVEPFNIEKLVKYTRKQVLLLDMLSNKDILQSRNIWKDI